MKPCALSRKGFLVDSLDYICKQRYRTVSTQSYLSALDSFKFISRSGFDAMYEHLKSALEGGVEGPKNSELMTSLPRRVFLVIF